MLYGEEQDHLKSTRQLAGKQKEEPKMWRVLRFLPLVLVLALATTVAYADHFPVTISGSGLPLEVGTGTSTSWSSDVWDPDELGWIPTFFDDTIGSGVATLEVSVEDGSTGIAGAIYFLDEPVSVSDFSPLGPVVNTTEVGEASWDPIIGVLVDVDGDGYEADPAAWQLSFDGAEFDPALLGDDTFIQCEAPGFSETGWVFLSDVSPWSATCYTPDEEGTGYDSFYGPYVFFVLFPIGRVDTLNTVVGVYSWIGGSSSWVGQTTLFDNFYYFLFSESAEAPEGEFPFRVLTLDPPVVAEGACAPAAIAFQATLNGEPTDMIGYGLDVGGMQLPYWSGTAVDAFGRHGMGLIRCLPEGNDYRLLFQVGDGPVVVSNRVSATDPVRVITVEVSGLPEYGS